MPATISLTVTGDTPDSVTLLTLVRTDTGAAVSFGDGIFTDAGGGIWSYTFTPPAENVTYAHTFRLTWPDATFTDGSGSLWVGSAVGYIGRYTSEAVLDTMLAVYNANSMFNLSGVTPPVRDTGAVRLAIEWGEGQVDLHAWGGVGAIPLTFEATAAGAVGEDIVERWATGLAVYNGAQKRGLSGVELSPYEKLRDEILAEIKAYREGTLTLPGVVEETADDDIVNIPSVAKADGSAVTAADLSAQAWRERVANAGGYYPHAGVN